MSAEQFGALGSRLTVVPGALAVAGLMAQRALLEDMKTSGSWSAWLDITSRTIITTDKGSLADDAGTFAFLDTPPSGMFFLAKGKPLAMGASSVLLRPANGAPSAQRSAVSPDRRIIDLRG